MPVSKTGLIARATAYFADVVRFETEAILSHLTEDVVLDVPTDGVHKAGKGAVRETYVKRAERVAKSWHGNFEFTADESAQRLAVRLDVKRTNIDGNTVELDTLSLLTFEGDKISAIAVWMSGENTLT